jgi:penicillin-binding protein 1C
MSTAGAKAARLSFRINKFLPLAGITCIAVLTAATAVCLKPVPAALSTMAADAEVAHILDRNGVPLTSTYQNRWNTYDYKKLYDIPDLLKEAFIVSEDRRFFTHHGVDVRALGGAIMGNLRRGAAVRGASTITGQVVRLVNPRPRNLWSKWMEGIEAALLEQNESKADILEFYLNEIPYASNRRGIAQAARYYFDRDLKSLSPREMLALVVLARAPSGYDLYRHPERTDAPIERLADALFERRMIDDKLYAAIKAEKIILSPPRLPGNAPFADYARLSSLNPAGALRTTIDAGLQQQVQNILDTRVKDLLGKNVHQGAVLIVDHETNEILAWAVTGTEIDAVTTPRQPGSALKPFLYALALDKGWTAATMIDDSPVAEAVGNGLHRFHNYSNTYYGEIPLREALGNSLNIPAVMTAQHVGVGNYLETLRHLGFSSLGRSAEIYGDGLALGNGEVTLFELVQGYAALANHGLFHPLRILQDDIAEKKMERIYSDESASLIANILSDPHARQMEFGQDSVLNLSVQTAAKTGTSTGYRDAWVAGFNDRYVVGIWMGNLDGTGMENVTGSTGPALALRSIFALLNKHREARHLYLSPRLVEAEACRRPAENGAPCPKYTEWFIPGTEPKDSALQPEKTVRVELIRPTDGMEMAYDPRVPANYQKFRFEVAGIEKKSHVEWIVNGKLAANTTGAVYAWPLAKGQYNLAVNVVSEEGRKTHLSPVEFTVK